MSQELIRADEPTAALTTWTPRFEMSTQEAVALVHQREEFLTAVLRPGVDYGVIPGTSTKPTLLKPGAERVLAAMGLHAELKDDGAQVEDFVGTEEHGGEPLIVYKRKCEVYRQIGAEPHQKMLVASATGLCSSREKKYRYRNADRVCPECGKPETLKISKGDQQTGEGKGNFYCWAKLGGCGKQFNAAETEAIKKQPVGKMLNPDIADTCNTILKMADKRALVAAAIMATGYSDYLTQDREDEAGEYGPEPDEQQPAPPRGGAATQRHSARPPEPKPAQKPQRGKPEVIDGEAQEVPSAPAEPQGEPNPHAAEIRQLIDKGYKSEMLSKSDLAKVVAEVPVDMEEIKKNTTTWIEALDTTRALRMVQMLRGIVAVEEVPV